MIAFASLVLRVAIEIVFACHCNAWKATDFGPRCIEPRDHPRCELIDGVHPAAYGVLTCSKGNCDD